MRELASALDEWCAVVGEANVVRGAAPRRAAETATFATSQKVPAIVRPADGDEVAACVRVAARRGVPLSPVSRGANWGYGSRVPAQTGTVLLDLSRLDRVGTFDEELGFVEVEPGVTFRRLHAFLRERGSRLLAPGIGGSADSSVLGNLLERGIAKGPYGDRFAHACAFEAVVGSGERVRTGLASFGDSRAARVHRWGTGPGLEGLFAQSGFGVVTRATIWLPRRPEHLQLLSFHIADAARLGGVVSALRQLFATGALQPVATLYNDLRALSCTIPYPWAERGAGGLLGAETRRRLEPRAWAGDAPLFAADADIGRALRRRCERVLGPAVDAVDALEASAPELDALLDAPPNSPTVNSAEGLRQAILRNVLGVPTDEGLRSAYWLRRTAPSKLSELEASRCGLLWLAPVVPLSADDVGHAVATLEAGLSRRGFEPCLSLQCMTERCAYAVASISYDRDEAGADERASTCHRELTRELVAQGFPPYRLSIDAMGVLRERDAPTARFAQALRDAADPRRVLAPGRYGAGASGARRGSRR